MYLVLAGMGCLPEVLSAFPDVVRGYMASHREQPDVSVQKKPSGRKVNKYAYGLIYAEFGRVMTVWGKLFFLCDESDCGAAGCFVRRFVMYTAVAVTSCGAGLFF